MKKPLSGIKVLELADYVSAPVCCRLLADLGAEVIKIERNTGNVWRVTGKNYVPTRFTDEENPVYDIYNTGKKHITLDLKTEEGMKICKELLATSDVFVTNNRLAALKRLGLSYEDIKDEFPRLIYAIGLGYGEKGPSAEDPAYDQTAFWARNGFLLDMAPLNENYMPVCPPASMGDTVTGLTLMGEICAALFNRTKTGKGDYVRSSLYHNGIFAMGTMQIIAQKPFGRVYPRTRAEHSLPNGYYKCKDDQYIFIASGYAPQLVPGVFKMIGLGHLIDDERFNSIEARNENRDEFYQILCDSFIAKSRDEWINLGKQFDIPVSPMTHFSDISEDEQAWANGYVQYVSYANGNTDIIASSPIEMDSVGPLETLPSGGIGHDNDEILSRLGYDEQEIALLKEKRVI
jgi:crotonobetainyl-CoA:carnitine CoA-transferase CaiB-like acyl-CoA transferase